MKALSAIAALPLLLLPLSGCDGGVQAHDGASGDQPAGASGGLADSLRQLGADEMKQKADEIVASVRSSFDAVRDEVSAAKVRETVEPLLGQLETLKSSLGAKMPSLDSLKNLVADLKARFAGNDAILRVLQPVLDKIQNLAR